MITIGLFIAVLILYLINHNSARSHKNQDKIILKENRILKNQIQIKIELDKVLK